MKYPFNGLSALWGYIQYFFGSFKYLRYTCYFLDIYLDWLFCFWFQYVYWLGLGRGSNCYVLDRSWSTHEQEGEGLHMNLIWPLLVAKLPSNQSELPTTTQKLTILIDWKQYY